MKLPNTEFLYRWHWLVNGEWRATVWTSVTEELAIERSEGENLYTADRGDRESVLVRETTTFELVDNSNPQKN